MPTYQYHCQDCGADLEVFQRMADSSLTVCPRCEGHLRKVFSAVGVVFKGSGFYATDSRSKGRVNAAADSPAKTETGDKPAPAAESAATKPAAESTGAKPAPAAPAPAATPPALAA
ncbi:MAG: zinc ribbon domain-containing protein [Propionibacteriaceae bacterium]|jgi:putative FmdB family regulatory protein|nr:zinc ribbon domain-containing protein [Propionibacteriaceae bacterium]